MWIIKLFSLFYFSVKEYICYGNSNILYIFNILVKMVLLFINCFVFNLILLKIGKVYNYKKVRYLKLIWYVFLYFKNDGGICWVINRCYLIFYWGF